MKNIIRIMARMLVKFLFRVQTVNFEQLPFGDRLIIMPNHVSFLDGLFLALYLPKNTVFAVNRERAHDFKLILKFANFIKIDQANPYSMRKIINLVNAGVPVVIFPEGRISITGSLMKIYDGPGFVALKTGATIYPCVINGSEYSKMSRVKDKVRTRWLPKIQLFLDDPCQMTFDKNQSFKQQKREASAKILKIMQKAIFNSRFYGHPENLFEQLLQAAHVHGRNSEIAEDLKQKVTYKQVLLTSYILGGKLNSMIDPNEENVGVLLPNAIAHLCTLFGFFFVNKTPAIFNFSAGTQTNLDCAQTAGIKTVVTSREFVEKGGFAELIEQFERQHKIIYLEDVKETLGLADKLTGLWYLLINKKPAPAEHHRVILFTSGSESKPKGVVLKHSNILANMLQALTFIDLTPKDKFFSSLPMFHSFGLTAGTLLPVLFGMPVFLYPTPLHYKQIPEYIYDRNATVILGTSTFFAGYGKYAHPYDFYSIRFAIVGAEKLKDETRQLWLDKFGIRILEGYGCTETAPILALNTPMCYRQGTVGKLLPGIEYKLQTVEGINGGGNLLVKGPNVMEGYLLNDIGFVPADEWYDSGDVVEFDQDDYITIKSRLKRFAKLGGEMVSLNLVEELAHKCFGNDKNYAAVNVSDAKKGEIIVLVTNDENTTLQVFKEFLNNNRYNMLMSPAKIMFIENLPLLGSGKTDYVSLQAWVQQ